MVQVLNGCDRLYYGRRAAEAELPDGVTPQASQNVLENLRDPNEPMNKLINFRVPAGG